jgi:hypothetical protein
MTHHQRTMLECLWAVSVGGAESIILSTGGTESMMLSVCAESIIFSALALRVLTASYSQRHLLRV